MLKDLLLVGLTVCECVFNNPILFVFFFIGTIGFVGKKCIGTR